MARLAGLEPATLGLEGRCSIQMSYRRIFKVTLDYNNKLVRAERFIKYIRVFYLRTSVLRPAYGGSKLVPTVL